MTLMANTSILHNSSGYRCPIKTGIPPLGSPHREHSFGPLNVPFAPFSRSLLHTFTLERNFERLTILQVTLGYRYAIIKQIPRLDYPHRELSFGLLNVPFAPFSRSFLHSCTLGRNFEPLTILQVTLGYRHVITKRIPRLDFPHREHSFGLLYVPFAPFSRSLLHTSTLGRNLEPLTILQAILGYRHAITKWIPWLDSPPLGHSLEPLNIPFAPFSGCSFSLICI